MPRSSDIFIAFVNSIHHAPNGKRTVSTRDFVAELKRYGWDYSLREANTWIEAYTHNFRDISTEEGDARTFFLFNPNGGY